MRLKNSRGTIIPKLDQEEALRFWLNVEIGGKDDCWPWRASEQNGRYGRLKIQGRCYSAHRVAYELSGGQIPDLAMYHHGAMVMHTCDHPPCCNPYHLRLGTARDNAIDMARKGRNYRPTAAARQNKL